MSRLFIFLTTEAAITKKITIQTVQAVRHFRVQCSLGSSNPAPDHIARVVGGQVDRSLGLQMKTDVSGTTRTLATTSRRLAPHAVHFSRDIFKWRSILRNSFGYSRRL
jgi:hypothetical protein